MKWNCSWSFSGAKNRRARPLRGWLGLKKIDEPEKTSTPLPIPPGCHLSMGGSKDGSWVPLETPLERHEAKSKAMGYNVNYCECCGEKLSGDVGYWDGREDERMALLKKKSPILKGGIKFRLWLLGAPRWTWLGAGER